ncbi:universal stress protein, partial [Halolamina salina]
GLQPGFVERLERRGEEAVHQVADEISAEYAEADVRTIVEQTTQKGAAGVIATYVEENDVDAVVMGSHGRGDLKRALLGSVASKVLRSVDVPVLVAVRGGR